MVEITQESVLQKWWLFLLICWHICNCLQLFLTPWCVFVTEIVFPFVSFQKSLRNEVNFGNKQHYKPLMCLRVQDSFMRCQELKTCQSKKVVINNGESNTKKFYDHRTVKQKNRVSHTLLISIVLTINLIGHGSR